MKYQPVAHQFGMTPILRVGTTVFTYLGEKVVKENEYLSAMIIASSELGQ